jgi:transposase-like protein
MSQHFLLSAQARTLSLIDVMKLSEQQAHDLFKTLRWGKSDDDMVCPVCGTVHSPYKIKSRNQYRCKHCGHTFSVTSGTIFANHKLPIKTYLLAIVLFVNAAKGISSLQLGRDLGVQYKTAFVLAHKIRQSLMEKRDDSEKLSGVVHMDGAYVNGHTRPKNKKADRVDRRLIENQNLNKRCVLVFRQGIEKTRTFVVKSETQEVVKSLACLNVANDATVHADESNAYDPLHGLFNTKRVNHSLEYRTDDGITNNYAESFFSRFRRMQRGQHHHISNRYLDNYANEAAYREDTRLNPNGSIFNDLARKCLMTRSSRDWCGYWQGNKRQGERLSA